MIDLRHIYSLSDFQRNAREHIDRLKRIRRPEVLTVNGKAELVVQDAGSYQELLDHIEGQGSYTTACRTRAGEGSPEAGPLEPDPVIEAYKDGVDRTLLRENLKKTVDERLQGLLELQRLAAETRRAGRSGSVAGARDSRRTGPGGDSA